MLYTSILVSDFLNAVIWMIDKMLPIRENSVKWRIFTVQLYNTALAVTYFKKFKFS